jgi:hypothetical protein
MDLAAWMFSTCLLGSLSSLKPFLNLNWHKVACPDCYVLLYLTLYSPNPDSLPDSLSVSSGHHGLGIYGILKWFFFFIYLCFYFILISPHWNSFIIEYMML